MAVVKGDANPPSRASTTSRPTIRDVARAAGVSQSTTSRALRNQGYVAAEVRERVHKAAAKLGYVPDVMARHLRQRVSRAIGVLVSDLRNSFYADLAAGASRAAKRAGYMVMLVDDRLLADEELEASEGLRLDAGRRRGGHPALGPGVAVSFASAHPGRRGGSAVRCGGL